MSNKKPFIHNFYLLSKIITFAICALLIVTFSKNSYSLTKEDCRKRVENAMHNSDVLRGSEADRYRWAQNAADECFKEIARNNSYSSSKASEGAGFNWLWLIGGLGLLYWIFYRPDVNGFRIPFVNTAEGNDEKEFKKKYYRSQSLRSQFRNNFESMKVGEISNLTESSKVDTVFWLVEENKTCRDFPGLLSITMEDLVELTGASVRSIKARLTRRGLKCMENNNIKINEKIVPIDSDDDNASPELMKVAKTKDFKDWYASSDADDIEKYSLIRLYLGLREIDKLAKKYANDSYGEFVLVSILTKWKCDVNLKNKDNLIIDVWMRENYKKIFAIINRCVDEPIPLDELISAFESGFNKIPIS